MSHRAEAHEQEALYEARVIADCSTGNSVKVAIPPTVTCTGALGITLIALRYDQALADFKQGE
jgi:hypothetical protein